MTRIKTLKAKKLAVNNKDAPNTSATMHPRNVHRNGYPMSALCQSYPTLEAHVVKAKSGQQSIDFSKAASVKALNAALLIHYYGLNMWDIPDGYLCPPVPGRADYIHGLAELLAKENKGVVPTGNSIKGLDVGLGANAIYSIIGSQTYGWRFVGSDIDDVALKSATALVNNNPKLKPLLAVRKQHDKAQIFTGIIQPDEHFAFSLCNPPFHKSAQEAATGSLRKVKGLGRHKQKHNNTSKAQPITANKLNFAGQSNELWCEGGELAFIQRMIKESVEYQSQVEWYTCLVSKSAHLKAIETSVRYFGAKQFMKIEMGQGQKISRFVAWKF